MSASRLDAVYRSILITKFFTKGWGRPDNLRRLFDFRKVVSNREECYRLIPPDYPVTITKEEKRSDVHILEGHFDTPMMNYLPGVVPPCAQKAHFQVVLPATWQQEDYKPMCVHLAGTGDHYFWRRRNLMAKPLLKEGGIGSIILENPFYGLRKPEDQIRSSLHNVTDIFVMGGCLILETLVLLHWCERNGYGPLGVTGLSMGGHMASLAATNWPKPLVLVPCLSWSTASAVFTDGVMANSINWELLETQFFSDGEYRDKLAKMVTIVDEAFLAGRKFAQQFSRNSDKYFDLHSLNLQSIYNRNAKIDITNPNSMSIYQGVLPDQDQNYSITTTNINILNNISNNLATMKTLKDTNQISESLYRKITSKKKFYLDHNEINELNNLAFRSSTPLNQNDDNCVETQNSAISNVSIIEAIKNEAANIPALVNKNSTLDMSTMEGSGANNKNFSNSESTALIPVDKSKSENFSERSTVSAITRNILSNIPFIMKQKDEMNERRHREALQFMRGVMDEFTHLGNFSIPYDTSLIIAVCAKNDAYVPRGDCGALEDLWPGAEVRYIDAGHVSAYVLYQSLFRSCIIEAFKKAKAKQSDVDNQP